MALWLKILIVILAVHYALAIAVLFLVLRDNLNTGVKIRRAKLICWNLFVLFIPILGPLVYCIYRLCTKSKTLPNNTTSTEYRVEDSNQDTNGTLNTTETVQTELEKKENTTIKNEDK